MGTGVDVRVVHGNIVDINIIAVAEDLLCVSVQQNGLTDDCSERAIGGQCGDEEWEANLTPV